MISSYLPCIIIVTLVAKYYYSYKASLIVNSSFKAIIPAVIGLLSAVSIFLGKASLVNISTFGITMASFSLIAFTTDVPLKEDGEITANPLRSFHFSP